MMINKYMLQCFLSLGLKPTEISKLFNVGRALVARWMTFHQSSNVLKEPEDDNEIIQILRETQKFYPNVGFRCDVGISDQRTLKQSKQD